MQWCQCLQGEEGEGGKQTDKKNERMKREGGEKYMQYTHVDNILVIVTSTTRVSILHTTICIHLLQQCLTVYTTISILRYPGAPAKMKPQMVNEYNHISCIVYLVLQAHRFPQKTHTQRVPSGAGTCSLPATS